MKNRLSLLTMLLSCLLLVSGLAGCSQEESSAVGVTMTVLEEPPNDASYIRFVDETTATPTWHLLFSTDETVTDFRLLALEDTMRISETLYTLAELTPDKPLVVSTYMNDVPANRAFSVTSASGKTQTYSIEFSGKDGTLSLLLWPGE